jgi:tetratricopeptide (TPR) repeat protein
MLLPCLPLKSKRMSNKQKINYRKWAILIFGVAFVIRLIYLLQIKSNPFFYSPMIDELWNIQWANEILEKSFWGESIYFRGPLYPYLLALLLKITGSHYFWVRLIQMIIASASVSLTYLLGREYFSERVARLGSVFCAFYGTLILYEGMFLIPVIFVFLNLLGLLILARNRDNPHKFPFLMAGLVFGLSAIARPNVLLVVPFLAIWLIYHFRKRIEKRSIIILALTFLIGVALPVAPVTARNYLIVDDLVLISSQGGINLYLGNNRSAEGLTMVMPEIVLDASIPWTKFNPTVTEYAENEVGHPLKPSEVSEFWTNKAKQFIFEHPGEFIGLTFRKLVYFFSGFENPDQHDIYDFRKYSSLLSILIFDYGLKFPYGLLAPLSLLGMAFCYRRRSEMAPLYIFFLAYLPTVILFLVTARHRLTVIPIMLLFAAYAFFVLWDRFKRANWKKLAVPIISLVILLGLANNNFFDLGFQNVSQIHYNMALTHTRLGEYDEAIKEYNLAITETPGVPALYFGLGSTYLKMNRYDQAVGHLKHAVSINPDYTNAYINLGQAYMELGDNDRAQQAFRRAAYLEPDRVEPHINLGDLFMSAGDLPQAAESFHRAMELNPDDHIVSTKLGVLYGQVNDTATAFEFFRLSLSINPTYAPGYHNWANIYLVAGDTTSAIEKYGLALQFDSLRIETYYNLAILYIRLGDRRKALENVNTLLRIEPGYQKALDLKQRLEG